MSLPKVFSDIKRSNCNYCVLCFRTDKVRKLKVSTSLNALVSLLDPEHVWLWKNNRKLEHCVCNLCESRISSALRTVNMVCFAVRCDKLLDSFKKSDKIDEHLAHIALRCQRDLKYIRHHTMLAFCQGVGDETQTVGKDGCTFTINVSANIKKPLHPNNSTLNRIINLSASTSNIQTYSNQPTTPPTYPITQETNTVTPKTNPTTSGIVPMVPLKVTIPPKMPPFMQRRNPNPPAINPISSSLTSTNKIKPQMNTITPLLVNTARPLRYTITPSMNTILAETNTITRETNPITPQTTAIKTGTDAIMVTDADETEPDCYIKSETESVTSEHQLDEDFEEALDAIKNDLDDYILPDLKQVGMKRKITNSETEWQKNDQPASKNTIKLVPQDKLFQPQPNPTKQETNPIKSDINSTATNTGRILACTLNNGDMAFCPIVDFGGKNYVPALKCVLENGILSPVENMDWEKLTLLTNNTEVNDMMTDLAQTNMQGIISSLGANPKPLPNNLSLNDVIPLSNIGNSMPNSELADPLSLLNKDSVQDGLDTSRLHGGMAPIHSGTDTIRLQIRTDPSRLQGGLDSRSQGNVLPENGNAKCIFGNRNVSRPMSVSFSNACQNRQVVKQYSVRFNKGSKLVIFDRKIPKLIVPKLTDAEIERYGNRTKYNKTASQLNKLRKEMRFVANPNSGYRNPSVARLDTPMPALGFSVASNQIEIAPESVASIETSTKPDNYEENFRVFASAPTSNVQPKRSDASIDWEDKIPMDVITYMNATDPNAAKYLTPAPPKPPQNPQTTSQPPPAVKDCAFGFITNCVGADDVICLD